MNKCTFDLAWVSKGCQNVADQTGFCDKHKKEKCWKCNEQATGECDDAGSFVCGTSECKKHSHYEIHNKK